MNVRDLLDVQAICEAGSFRKAAVALGITQPTLSARIAHLEDQLGARLFDRSRGQSRPTALAEFIATRAAGLSSDASLLSRDLQRLASGQAGLVRLGLGPALLRVLVVPLATRIGTQHPGIGLEIHSGASAVLRGRLLQREIDMVLASPLEPADPAIEAELLLETESVILARPDHPMFVGPPPGIRELFQYPAALPFMEPRYADFLRTHFGVDFEAQHGRLVCSDIDALAQVAAASPHFFTAGPRFAFAAEIASGKLRVLKTAVPTRHLVLLQTHRNAYPLPAVELVRESVRQVFMEFVASIP